MTVSDDVTAAPVPSLRMTRWTGVSSAGSSMPVQSRPVGRSSFSDHLRLRVGRRVVHRVIGGGRGDRGLLHHVGDQDHAVVGADAELLVAPLAEELGRAGHGDDPGAIGRVREQL